VTRTTLPALIAALTIGAPPAYAQTWPTRPIEVIIPFPAGGGVDVIARAVTGAMAAELGTTTVAVNREGAGGTLAFNVLAGAAPDGYTLGGGPTTPVANAPYLVKGVRYGIESFDYICQTWENVMALAVTASSPFRTAQDLFAAAAANPGKLTYGHAGLGTIPHLAAENMAEALKLKFQHVPFRGDASMLPVLLKGELDFGAVALSSIRGLDLRLLAVFADSRRPTHPDIPTDKEFGVAHSVPPGHNGVFTPKGVPEPIRARLQTACANAVKNEQVLRTMSNAGQVVTYLSGEKFREQTVADYKFKGDLIRRLGLEAK
jgi:tripartite-type tricarboxylate transporter receptor subunit TctC